MRDAGCLSLVLTSCVCKTEKRRVSEERGCRQSFVTLVCGEILSGLIDVPQQVAEYLFMYCSHDYENGCQLLHDKTTVPVPFSSMSRAFLKGH